VPYQAAKKYDGEYPHDQLVRLAPTHVQFKGQVRSQRLSSQVAEVVRRVPICDAMAQSDRYKKLHTRYEALTARATAGGSLLPDTAYADFLK